MTEDRKSTTSVSKTHPEVVTGKDYAKRDTEVSWRNVLLIFLFFVLVTLQAASTTMQFITLAHLESIRSGVWNSPKIASEYTAQELRKEVVKVAVCDSNGKNCADTSVAKVTTGPNFFRRSPTDPATITTATYGLLVTNSDRP